MRHVIALLAVAGLVVSYLALRVHYSNDVQPCDINEHWDCGVVNHSPFAMVGPVPVAAIGMAGYALLAGLAMLRRRVPVAAGAVVGLAFALYLSHIEKDVLTVWCLYCVISQGLIFLIAVLGAIWVWTGRRTAIVGKADA
jgi:vitamin-K-epoxide reductase (warfarin-sensitive)